MQFALLIYESPEEFAHRAGPEAEAYWTKWSAYSQLLTQAASAVTGGLALQGPETATRVWVTDAGRRVEDGPFADTKEQLGGFFVVDVASEDEAIRLAAMAPNVLTGAVEVRAVPDYAG